MTQVRIRSTLGNFRPDAVESGHRPTAEGCSVAGSVAVAGSQSPRGGALNSPFCSHAGWLLSRSDCRSLLRERGRRRHESIPAKSPSRGRAGCKLPALNSNDRVLPVPGMVRAAKAGRLLSAMRGVLQSGPNEMRGRARTATRAAVSAFSATSKTEGLWSGRA